MKNYCSRPFKLPRRKKYGVLTNYVEVGDRVLKFYSYVKAENKEDALSQCGKVVLYCGEPVVERMNDE